MKTIGMKKYTWDWFRYLTLLAILCLTTYGCSQVNGSGGSPRASNAIISTEVPSITPTLPGTPTLSGPELDATKMAGLATWEAPQNQMETQVAEGTPPPIPTMFDVPTAPALWTPTLGITYECATASNQFDYGGCWAGIINNEYVFVATGALMADPPQGVVRVYTATMNLQVLGPKHDYVTPSRAGRVHPIQVVWPVMTLVTLDNNPPVYYAFDLETRQWMTPTPGPSPSVPASPISSISPRPTKQP